jgi:hypothetical protein
LKIEPNFQNKGCDVSQHNCKMSGYKIEDFY